MLISVLMEDTASTPQFASEHGLSLWIQMEGLEPHTLLFDTGKSALLRANSEQLGINLSEAEYIILSHGHYDHAGGLTEVIQRNATAPILLHPEAVLPHYALRSSGKLDYIGIPSELLAHPRLQYTSAIYPLGKWGLLFSGIQGKEASASSNHVLRMVKGGIEMEDDFIHEQNLLLREESKLILITGCAHRGILNILERAAELAGRYPDFVLGGFHLSNPTAGTCEPESFLNALAVKLLERVSGICYTGHCTGTEAFGKLQAKMGKRLRPLSTGLRIQI